MSPEDHARDLAKERVGNWRKFTSFVWHHRPDDAAEWCIIETHNRDSGLLAQSNAAGLDKLMAPFLESEECRDVLSHRAGHWAVGWTEGYAIRVYKNDKREEVTEAFARYSEWHCAIEDYPIWDENDLADRESKALYENVERAARSLRNCDLRDNLSEDWIGQVIDACGTDNLRRVDGDQGECPPDDDIREALESLGFLEPVTSQMAEP